MIQDSLTYPFRGSGKFMLGIGTIIYLVLSVASQIAFGIASLIAYVFFVGIIGSYFREVIYMTSEGVEEAPGFPDLSDLAGC